MRTLVITVAGMATRFSESVGKECLKCAYYDQIPEESILYRLLHLNPNFFDQFIVVGGFHYDELQQFVQEHLQEYKDRITLIYNEHFRDYGSGYSLYLGISEALKMGCSEVVFAEGDLYLDQESFVEVCDSMKDVLTSNRDTILASKSVAYYFDTKGFVHYIFDTKHGELEVKEPFTEIGNSGQVWKFSDMEKLDYVLQGLSKQDKQGTNLIIVQNYFGERERDAYDIVQFKDWINCNTVSDFRRMQQMEGTF